MSGAIAVKRPLYLSMRLVLLIWPAVLIGCSNPIDGLWIEKGGRSLLKFYGDSVIANSLEVPLFRDTLGYRISTDSITFTGLNSEMTVGTTEVTHRYSLKGDSLIIWTTPGERLGYFKSDAENYFDYFVSKGGLKLKLPRAENTRLTPNTYVLNVKIGYKDDQVNLIVENEECSFSELDLKIKTFLSQYSPEELLYTDAVTCQLFIDEAVSCEYTFRVIDYLKSNGLWRVNFITLAREYDPNTNNFYGLFCRFPATAVRIIEVKDDTVTTPLTIDLLTPGSAKTE